jgi:protein-L-isoaspartate(D-aspartate) O-methyltransferase
MKRFDLLLRFWAALWLLGSTTACAPETGGKPHENNAWDRRRADMVAQLRAYQITDERLLAAMGKVRRHMFIPESYRRADAYGDHPCPIGYDQTISQPFIVAYMTACMKLRSGEKVLEIGTGSGYQAAILAELGAHVYSVEIIPELAAHARQALRSEGYPDVRVLTGDGYKGWPEFAPFDVIIVTCAPDKVPSALVAQLKDGGRMILPVGTDAQRLVMLRKSGGNVEQTDDLPVRFVPMVRGKD